MNVSLWTNDAHDINRGAKLRELEVIDDASGGDSPTPEAWSGLSWRGPSLFQSVDRASAYLPGPASRSMWSTSLRLMVSVGVRRFRPVTMSPAIADNLLLAIREWPPTSGTPRRHADLVWDLSMRRRRLTYGRS